MCIDCTKGDPKWTLFPKEKKGGVFKRKVVGQKKKQKREEKHPRIELSERILVRKRKQSVPW